MKDSCRVSGSEALFFASRPYRKRRSMGTFDSKRCKFVRAKPANLEMQRATTLPRFARPDVRR